MTMIAFSPEIIKILGDRDYWNSKYIAIPLIVIGGLIFIYNLIIQGEYYYNKTKYIFLGSVVTAVINIIANFYFIKKYGYIAAAYTTLSSYLIYIHMHYFIAKKICGFSIVPLKDIELTIVKWIVFAVYNLIFIEDICVRWITLLLIFVCYLKKVLNSKAIINIDKEK